MKLNGTRLEKRSPRKKKKFQPRNGGQKTTLLKSHGVSIRKLQLEKSKPAKFRAKNIGILAFFGE